MPAAASATLKKKPARVRRVSTTAGRTAVEAHARLDVHEQQIENLTDVVEGMAQDQGELTRSVSELTKAVGVLEACTSSMQQVMSTFVQDTEKGRETLTKMIGEVLEKKTGSWVLWAAGGALLTARDWVPLAWKILSHAAAAP